MSVSNLKRFNDVIEEFIDDLMDTYSENKYFNNEFTKFKYSHKLLRNANPEMCLSSFVQYVYKYKEPIMNENESFFMNHDYSEETKGDQQSLMTSLKLKELWQEEITTDEIKKNIFKYFKVLIVLSERCMQERIKSA